MVFRKHGLTTTDDVVHSCIPFLLVFETRYPFRKSRVTPARFVDLSARLGRVIAGSILFKFFFLFCFIFYLLIVILFSVIIHFIIFIFASCYYSIYYYSIYSINLFSYDCYLNDIRENGTLDKSAKKKKETE